MRKVLALSSCLSVALCGALAASANAVQLKVTAENLAPENSVSLAPLRFGFGNGTFDAFDNGQAAFLLGYPSIAQAPITTIAEGGSGSNWFPAFAAAEPNANTGSVVGTSGNAGPPLTPGEASSTLIEVDTANQFFTFGTMVVPSNDFFLSNDSPTEHQAFDASGNLLINSITLTASDIWDAGTETENPANAAFLVVGTNSQREDENGVVHFNFSELSTFDGLVTAEGYSFDSSLLSANTEVLRISFEVVPEPGTAAMSLLASAGLVLGFRRHH